MLSDEQAIPQHVRILYRALTGYDAIHLLRSTEQQALATALEEVGLSLELQKRIFTNEA